MVTVEFGGEEEVKRKVRAVKLKSSRPLPKASLSSTRAMHRSNTAPVPTGGGTTDALAGDSNKNAEVQNNSSSETSTPMQMHDALSEGSNLRKEALTESPLIADVDVLSESPSQTSEVRRKSKEEEQEEEAILSVTP